MTACFMVAGIQEMWGERVPGDERRTERSGAMAWWSHGRKEYDTQPRPMPHLAVMTPAGLACLDCPADKEPHGYWSRSGEPPAVTVTPSLNINPDGADPTTKWHGFLTAGQLAGS